MGKLLLTYKFASDTQIGLRALGGFGGWLMTPFVHSLTHSCNEATSYGFIELFCSVSLS
jgi:hypothetical protein